MKFTSITSADGKRRARSHQTRSHEDSNAVRDLLHGTKAIAWHLLQRTLGPINQIEKGDMRELRVHPVFFASAMLLLIGSRAVTQAQEAVSTTGSSAMTSSSATST